MPILKRIGSMMEAGNYLSASKEFGNLVPSRRSSELMMSLWVTICEGLDDTAGYAKALNDYKETYPDAIDIPLLVMRRSFSTKDYAGMLTAIDALDKQMNTDPYLDYYRAMVYKAEGDSAGYLQYIEQAYHYAPDDEQINIEMINACYQNGNRAKADSVMSIYRSDPHLNQQRLATWLRRSGYTL